MKKRSLIFVLLIAFLGLCQGCKSAKKSLKKGDFDDSVLRAVSKLKDNPNHASSLEILKKAYPAALDQHLEDIRYNRTTSDIFRWEKELDSYYKLNKLYNAIISCSSCRKAVEARNYENEEKAARSNAAAVRYKEGERFLTIGDRENARQAYLNFEKTEEIFPDYPGNRKKLEVSYELASFKVVIEHVLVTSKVYQLSNEYFQGRVNEFLQTNKTLNKFVRFYTSEEAEEIRLRPDQVITLQFDDFVVGQTVIDRNTETFVSKDSVKTGEQTIGKTKVPVYDKVKAKLTRNKKLVRSSGLLDMQIRDFKTKRMVSQEKFNGEYNWICEWAFFNGDERALTPEQLRLCKSQELPPPPPQQLFVEFSKPIYDRLTSRLRSFYANY
ncbi:hypothetical protein DYBT9275_03527 [Dyadobacter sp. CECT 9275]|uniref:Uncharacterized protein n=1 Tax=Dyadobacter helix TaxID=2822344 RepID=A0A916JE66_9BACT|nr:hypothetical protein [Dyadobacter sp. CECT 9275]CAG5005165.1 hypothetical protein DYBT9275_03527 [Dyadobacter sp. CECT 9275]